MHVTIFKHRKTKKNFIRVAHLPGWDDLFVTPPDENGNVRVLNLNHDLFYSDPEEYEWDEVLEKNIVSEDQFNVYKNKFYDIMQEVAYNWYKSLSIYERKRLLEEDGIDAGTIRAIEKLIEEGVIEEF